jgi:2-amino-4-hydroxy-6-hydroxymethyldihydropteridine diphosphokinase
VTTAYVGLGSNLGDREQVIRNAAETIGATRLSEIRETEPWGYADQPLFLNAVAEVETELGPRALLDELLDVERSLGRERGAGPRYGPRTIDLDLLLYGDEVIDEPGLTIPTRTCTSAASFSSPSSSSMQSSSSPAAATCRTSSRR